MIIENSYYKLVLNDENGSIESFRNDIGKEFISYSKNRSLFVLYYLNEKGERISYSSNDSKMTVSKKSNEILMYFNKIGKQNINATVQVKFDDSPFVKFSFETKNETNLHLDKIDYPIVVVPNDLLSTGGKGKIFSPMMEGLVVDDIEIREKTWMAYHETGYPAKGWEGIYPGATPIQFMSYFDSDNNGLYFATHDKYSNPKVIEFHKEDDGIKLEYQLFPGTNEKLLKTEFETVLGVFKGNWYDAAQIYRDFIEKSGIITLPKIKDNNNLPNWIKESPIVCCYPVRGEVDSHFDETMEYYPYSKASDIIINLGKELDSKMMPLLMHWEGTAPWAPPYVWPPFGDFSDFKKYINEIHNSGNYIGLYCSGIAWTQKSALLKTYNKEQEYKEKNLEAIMVQSPKGEVEYSYVCGSVGWRHDMCPACEKTREIATNELEKIVSNCDVDYIQFFDQVLGGGGYACYSKTHGHPYGPGKWNSEAMRELLSSMKNVLSKYNKEKNVLIGCEGNAAEPFINDYVFNDSRHNINYYFGTPVPAYNFVFHEYVNNFMGNQNTSSPITDFAKYPNNVYFRLAHSFVQGDILTIVLKDKGQINWDWCTPWNSPQINQEEFKTFIKECNAWRKNIAKGPLQYGKMVKPLDFKSSTYEEDILYGGKHIYNSIESCAYLYEEEFYQIFVNYLDFDQEIYLRVEDYKKCQIIYDYLGENKSNVGKCDSIGIFIPRRSVVMLKGGNKYDEFFKI